MNTHERTPTRVPRIVHVVFNRVHLLPPLLHELAWMRAQNFELHLIAPAYDQRVEEFARTLPHVHAVWLPVALRRLSAHPHPILKLVRYVEFLIRATHALVRLRADVIVGHDVTVMPAVRLARRLRRAAVLYHAHELWSEASEDNAPLRGLWRRVERWVVRAADRVAAPEPHRAEILRDEYGARQLPVLVRNIPPAAEDAPRGDGTTLHALLGLPADAQVVVYQGLVAASRCLEEAAGALALLPAHVHLVVIGGGEERMRTQLAAHAMHAAGRLHLVPHVDRAALAPLTASAQAGLLLYRNDGRNNYYAAPNKLYEYLFAGLPVVASDFPGLRAIVDEGGFGSCADPADPHAIADAIAAALTTADAGPVLAARARGRFRYEDDVAQLCTMYRQLTHPPILCFAGNDWWVHNPMPEKHWMRAFGARGVRVLYVNSIGIGMPALGSPGLAGRIASKLASLARWLRRGAPGVWVLTPVVLPLWSVPAVRRVNVVLLALQVRMLLALFGMRRPLFWAGLPTAAALLDAVPHRGVVYYVQDNYTAYYDEMRATRTTDDHAHMIEAADALVVAGVALGEELRERHEHVHVVPHGVPDSFFEAAAVTPPVPARLQALPRPVVGYWGSLDAVQDPALIEQLARAHPEWSFVYIGRPRIDLSRFAALPNVHFIGYVELDEIPVWGAHMDAFVMTFVQSEWIRYSCPVKLREYLALGRPVVGPDILEVSMLYADVARTTATRSEFVRALEEELAADTEAQRAMRRSRVTGWTWARTADEAARIVRSVVEGEGT
jgi:glycosyltransferase involved in cell wall biosynthesis